MDQQQLFLLLSHTAEGRQTAFEQLYHLTSGQLFAVAMKILKNKELAEEALQAAYVKIWHNAADYQCCKGSVLTWMVGVVRYRALDLLTAHDIHKPVNLSEQQIPHQYQARAPLTTTERARLEQCMEELDDDHRQAIQTAYFEGVSHQEVAERLSSNPITIKRQIRDGLQRIRRCLTL